MDIGLFLKRLRKKKNIDSDTIQKTIQRKENPYLPCLREILEQVLASRNLNYGNMRLLLIDTDTEPESLLDEDDVELALKQLSGELNFLTILTNRPAYFTDYVETMYEDTGLLVDLEEKGSQRKFPVNTVLDFEQRGNFWNGTMLEPSIYLPLYKKQWEQRENLDISVPIGYNTVIVKRVNSEVI